MTQYFHPEHLFHSLYAMFTNASKGDPFTFFSLIGAFALCGFVYAFFGYRVYRYILMLLGAAIGGFVAMQLSEFLKLGENQSIVMLILAGVFGLTASLMGPKLFRLFTFLLGGYTITLVLAPLNSFVQPPYNWLALLTCFVAGGFLAFLITRPVLILATSIAGSFVLAFVCIAVFIELGWFPREFNFFIFYMIWSVLGLFAFVSQLQYKSTSLRPHG